LNVYLVWNIRHAKFLDGSPTQHRDEDGELILDTQDGDDLKMLGIYATEDEAEGRIPSVRSKEGLRDEPDCFRSSISQSPAG